MSRTLKSLVAVLALVPLAFAAGCGSSDTSSAVTTTPGTSASATAGPAATALTVELGKGSEFSIVASSASVAAGKVTFTVTNVGAMMHEMVIVPAPAGGATALAAADGTAKEDGMIAEAEDVEVGTTKTITADLAPGKYILLCNVGKHFAAGMWTQLTVQ